MYVTGYFGVPYYAYLVGRLSSKDNINTRFSAFAQDSWAMARG